MRPGAALHALARQCGVQTSYLDVRGERCHASPESVIAVLATMGVEVTGPDDAERAVAAHDRDLWQRVLEPTLVAWDGAVDTAFVRLPGTAVPPEARIDVALEDGSTWTRTVALSETGGAEIDGRSFRAAAFTLPQSLPLGVHRLHLEAGSTRGGATLLAAPLRIPPSRSHTWGVAAPLYALRRAEGRGVGDLRDLRRLADWLEGLGGHDVAVLPLLATFSGPHHHDPSPYAPVSRMAWNECYLDLDALPGAGGAVAGPSPQPDLVDWPQETEIVHRALDASIASLDDAGRRALDEFAREHPFAAGYAAFRGDGDPAAERRHLFAQQEMERQLGALASALRERGQRIQLDLPVGVNPRGYDVSEHPELFALGASAGAPPDDFFGDGQVWGFPPPHPEAARADGHAYFRACLRHHLRFAGLLRVDHVMGLHRLFWVPDGASAADGVYVGYPADELHAAVALEAHRADAQVIGEDLGTVPPEVRRAMRRHGVLRTFAGQFALDEVSLRRELVAPPEGAVAMLNTHDMIPFASYWSDDADRRKLVARALDDDSLADDPVRALSALLAWLGASRADAVLATLEDLWLEARPQNVPGTGTEQPNWRRRATRTMEEIESDAQIAMPLRRLATARARSTR